MSNAMKDLNPHDFVITRKRKKYRFALFHNSPLCLEVEQWDGSYHPSVLELGAGTGSFSVSLASTTPSTRYLAVDVKADRLQTGARLATEKNIKNIRFLRARAEQLHDSMAAGSFDAIWLTFPDPFPKERSSKHRLTHPKYLALYHKLLKPGGKLYFKTDAVALFDWSLEQLAEANWQIHALSFDLHKSNESESVKTPTTYETRYIAEGKKICFVAATPPVATA